MVTNILREEIFHPDLNELSALAKSNKDLPHFTLTEFNMINIKPGNEVFGLEPVCQVATVDIIGSSSLSNWADVASLSADVDPANRTLLTFQKFLKNKFLPVSSAINLYDYGGKFVVSDGQRRVLVSKALGVETLPARVIKVEPSGVRLPTESLFNLFMSRKEAGLWDGELSFSLDAHGNYSGGQAIVNTAKGVWVFAKNMELVKSAYEQSVSPITIL